VLGYIGLVRWRDELVVGDISLGGSKIFDVYGLLLKCFCL